MRIVKAESAASRVHKSRIIHSTGSCQLVDVAAAVVRGKKNIWKKLVRRTWRVTTSWLQEEVVQEVEIRTHLHTDFTRK